MKNKKFPSICNYDRRRSSNAKTHIKYLSTSNIPISSPPIMIFRPYLRLSTQYQGWFIFHNTRIWAHKSVENEFLYSLFYLVLSNVVYDAMP